MVNDVVYTAEVVGGLNNVVHVNGFICNSYSIGFKDESCLLVGEFAAFNVVGVVCEVYLGAVIDAAVQFCFFLFA